MSAKRLVDIGFAAAGLVALAPLILALALAVRLTMGSPILFRQLRSGLHGEPFQIMKFRSMTDAREASGALLPDAARTTLLGALMRRTRLDELPELWHILQGEMSFVGPRPILPEDVTRQGELGRRRGIVRPGLTGWAQVNGNTLLSPEIKVLLDVWYVDRRSLGLDLLIIAKTLSVVLFGERINKVNVYRACEYVLSPSRGS